MEEDRHVILVVRCIESGHVDKAPSHTVAIVLGVQRRLPVIFYQVLLPVDSSEYVSFFYGRNEGTEKGQNSEEERRQGSSRKR